MNGLHYDPNEDARGVADESDLMRTADMVRVGLAGSLRGYVMETYDGRRLRLDEIAYGGGQPAGYVTSPAEVVNYVENHDNQTLYDLHGRYYDLYTRQHGIDSNLFLAPGEGDTVPEAAASARMPGVAAPSAASLLRGGIA